MRRMDVRSEGIEARGVDCGRIGLVDFAKWCNVTKSSSEEED